MWMKETEKNVRKRTNYLKIVYMVMQDMFLKLFNYRLSLASNTKIKECCHHKNYHELLIMMVIDSAVVVEKINVYSYG